jgi:hypothetical protein
MSEQWKFLWPTDVQLRGVLERFPTLTEMGLCTLEKQQRENDWRVQNGLPPIRHRQPVPITHPDQRRQIMLVRAYLREIQLKVSDPLETRYALSYVLQRAVARWAGERISNGATIAGARLEGCKVEPSPGRVGGAYALIWLSITREDWTLLSAFMWGAWDCMDAGLACVGIKTPRR